MGFVWEWSDAPGGLVLRTDTAVFFRVSDALGGANTLGRLLGELRDALRDGESTALRSVAPLPIHSFLLLGDVIRAHASNCGQMP
jgi:hypothetical protein